MSEEKAEHASSEPGSLGVGPAAPLSSSAPSEPVASSAREAHEPAHGSTDLDAPGPLMERGAPGETPAAAAPQVDAAAHASDVAEADAQHNPGKVIVMSLADRASTGTGARSEREAGEESQGVFGKRRMAAIAAVVALATVAGALGGALATAALIHVGGGDAVGGNHALEASVARIDADVVALKAGLEHTSRLGTSQFSKTSDRLDKIEKAQAEPAAKLAKLGETADKLRVAAVATAPTAAKEVTGSVPPPAAAAAAALPKAEVGRLPTVDGWALREVANGGAMIESRRGLFEVYAGDSLPGLGRIDAIRRQDGRWVVVTSKGLIVAR